MQSSVQFGGQLTSTYIPKQTKLQVLSTSTQPQKQSCQASMQCYSQAQYNPLNNCKFQNSLSTMYPIYQGHKTSYLGVVFHDNKLLTPSHAKKLYVREKPIVKDHIIPPPLFLYPQQEFVALKPLMHKQHHQPTSSPL